MPLEIVRRDDVSTAARWLAPLLAVAFTVVVSAAVFAYGGASPGRALYVYFIEPLTEIWSLHELAVKATPLILIAVGLSVCFRSNNWNIGAEGQFVIGAVAASAVPVLLPDATGSWILPTVLLMGALGGLAWAAVPAVLKNRFGTNEILVSLMLVYVAGFILDWLVRGPWRNPQGFNFPETRTFMADAMLPEIVSVGDWGGRANWGFVIAILAAIGTWFLLARTLKGFEVNVSGSSQRAAGFAGFDARRTTLFAFAFSGALAGLAGAIEVTGAIGQLRPTISPGYGFTAIIVAFLGRLHPIGIVIAGLVLGLTYLGGEAAQISLGLSERLSRVIQGVLLASILVADVLANYRFRRVGHGEVAA